MVKDRHTTTRSSLETRSQKNRHFTHIIIKDRVSQQYFLFCFIMYTIHKFYNRPCDIHGSLPIDTDGPRTQPLPFPLFNHCLYSTWVPFPSGSRMYVCTTPTVLLSVVSTGTGLDVWDTYTLECTVFSEMSTLSRLLELDPSILVIPGMFLSSLRPLSVCLCPPLLLLLPNLTAWTSTSSFPGDRFPTSAWDLFQFLCVRKVLLVPR